MISKPTTALTLAAIIAAILSHMTIHHPNLIPFALALVANILLIITVLGKD